MRPGLRRRGVTYARIAGVVEAARAAGAPGVEAWPIDTAGARVHQSAAYMGFTTTFERLGFRRVVETGARSAGLPRVLVRLDFGRAPGPAPGTRGRTAPHGGFA